MTCDQKTQNIKLKQYCNKFNTLKKNPQEKKILKNKKNSVGCFLKWSSPQPTTLITVVNQFSVSNITTSSCHRNPLPVRIFTPRKLIHCQIWKRKTSNTADKLGYRQGVRRLGGQFWVQREIPTTLQLEWRPEACTFHSSSMGFSGPGACFFAGHCPGPEKKQRPGEACGHRASTARPGRRDRLLLLGAHAPGGVGVCVVG